MMGMAFVPYLRGPKSYTLWQLLEETMFVQCALLAALAERESYEWEV